MANLAELKNRLAKMNTPGGKRELPVLRWYPTDEHDIRLVPFGENPLANSIIEVHFHYKLGETKLLLCPASPDLKNENKKCVINDYAQALWSKWDIKGKVKPQEKKDADFEVFKKIKAQVRYAALMVERGKEAEGVKWWVFNSDQLAEIIKTCESGLYKKACGLGKEEDAGYAVVVDAENAFDLHVSRQKANNEDKKGNKKMYDVTEITVRKDEPTPLLANKKEIAKFLENCKPFFDAYPLKSEEEIEKILDAFMKQEFTASEKTDPNQVGEPYGINSRENAASVGSRMVEEAKHDILNG